MVNFHPFINKTFHSPRRNVLRYILHSRTIRAASTSLSPSQSLEENKKETNWYPPCTFPKATEPLRLIPSRATQLKRLQNGSEEYDLLVVGGGATGAGIALDATLRGLHVACIERGDFGAETSSRSTKLIWAGIRYLATSAAGLLSRNLFFHPIQTVKDFWGEFNMVRGCHRERRFMLEKQKHLCNWVPIAIPFEKWIVWPPPFGHFLFSIFPVIAPFVLKFYDSLSGFTCPPSYVMGKKKSQLAFPQLTDRDIKYCAVFYEAQHNDSRTNISIAMTAAYHGAHICNYMEAESLLSEENSKRANGVQVRDVTTNETFEIRAKKIVFAGGPFTDGMRAMESNLESGNQNVTVSSKAKINRAVQGASGSHVILPGYYCPTGMGLLDYNTSDGRFLFFLPWLGHTIVGTTDKKCDALTSPSAPEDEIQWLLNECGKYLNRDLRVRRSDVLSAWRGWRPLAVDPHAAPGAPASRDHVISTNPETNVTFVAGGKWTTWREMAEDTIDQIIKENGFSSEVISSLEPCRTLDVTLIGGHGFSSNLKIKLTQQHVLSPDVAEHLARTYGGRSWDVAELARPVPRVDHTRRTSSRFGIPLISGYPYIEAEVRYACREYACSIVDILCTRTRLAYLNSEAALEVVPRVSEIMSEELEWTNEVKVEQEKYAREFLLEFGSPVRKGASLLRERTFRDVAEIFKALDADGSGFLDEAEVSEAATQLGFPLDKDQLNEAMKTLDVDRDGRVTLVEFVNWWNESDSKGSAFGKALQKELKLGAADLEEVRKSGFLG